MKMLKLSLVVAITAFCNICCLMKTKRKTKTLMILFLIANLLDNSEIQAQNVTIPNANFKAYLVGNGLINTNGDTEIQVAEAATFTGSIDCSSLSINNLTGIEAFTALTTLNCWNNQLTSLNVSNNLALTSLNCYRNYLSILNVNACTSLTTLNCYWNQLTSLNVSNNLALTTLECNNNQLTSLNVSNNLALTSINCWNNQLTSLNVSGYTALTNLNCRHNQLTSLDVNSCTALTSLTCDDNQLTNLNVSSNLALTYLDCYINQLTNLNVSNNLALTSLDCWNNQLTNLNVSGNLALTYLACEYNQLTSLDVSSNTALTYFTCSGNQLTSLNIKNGNNTNLAHHYFINNPALTCIQVDNVTYANANFTDKDAIASYSTACTTVGVQTIASLAQLNIYPNPVSKILNINTQEAITTKEIIDLSGRVVYTENDDKTTINVGNLPTGIYFIKLHTEKGVYQQKFVKA